MQHSDGMGGSVLLFPHPLTDFIPPSIREIPKLVKEISASKQQPDEKVQSLCVCITSSCCISIVFLRLE